MSIIRTYITGFVLSITLTLFAFWLVWEHMASGHTYPSHELIYWMLTILAVIQLGVQLVFFLHLGRESKPKWRLLAFSLTLIIVVILVGGTLWIMQNLSHGQKMHTAQELIDDELIPHK